MDPVGEVDVRAPRFAEQRVRAARETHVCVTGGLVHVVALALDDPARGLAVAHGAPDQAAGHLVYRAGVEVAARPQLTVASSRTWRAWASCSSIRASEVPPSDTFDS